MKKLILIGLFLAFEAWAQEAEKAPVAESNVESAAPESTEAAPVPATETATEAREDSASPSSEEVEKPQESLQTEDTPPTEELKKAQRAAEYAEAGWNYYYFAMYPEAEKEFSQAIKEDPKQQKNRLGYARSLIKTEKFEQAVEVLQASEDSEEATYLQGVAFFQQNSLEAADEALKRLSESDGKFSQSARNYLNVIEKRRRRLSLSAGSGVVYDSRIVEENVLNVSDVGGPRAYVSGQAGYRLLGGQRRQLSVLAEVQTVYSFDEDLSISDPLRLAVHLPYLGRAQKMGENQVYFAPGYELIRIDLAGTGSKEAFSNAALINYIATKRSSSSSLRTWRINLRWDQGEAASLTGPSNIDGASVAFKYDKYWFFNATQSHGLNFGLLFGGNFAKGENIKYGRAGANLSYLFPFFWRVKAAVLANLRYSNYFDHLQGRVDTEIIYGGRFSRKVNKWLSVDLNLFNNMRDSNVSDRDNSRFVGSVVANGLWTY